MQRQRHDMGTLSTLLTNFTGLFCWLENVYVCMCVIHQSLVDPPDKESTYINAEFWSFLCCYHERDFEQTALFSVISGDP